ncbi:Alpha/beta hydrolase fold-1 [Pisolithus marmoratus]|nr:Alpha/beta hydrolase fold-1 [Pisolithus marmoratus]
MQNPTPKRHVFSLKTTFGLRVADTLQDNAPGREDVAIQCAALKYPVSEGEQGLTLVLTHGLSSHKECFHPTVVDLLRLYAAGTRTHWIREVWLVDMPNHGESAVLNRAYLEDRRRRGQEEGWDGICNTMDFSAYLNAFLSIPQLQGHRVVGIAHSGSCTPWTHALTHPDRTHPHPFALILIEPVFMFPDMPPTDPRAIHGAANVRGVLFKRDKWSSRAEAKRWLLGKTIWSKWDDLALDLFVEHTLEEVHEPRSSPPQSMKSSSYVRSTLRKEEESPLYACAQHTVEPSRLTRMCTALTPGSGRGRSVGGVHVIWAELEEFITKHAQAEILDAMSHRVLSQRVVPGSGHLIPQENPSGLAHALYDILGGHIAVAAGLTVRAPL